MMVNTPLKFFITLFLLCIVNSKALETNPEFEEFLEASDSSNDSSEELLDGLHIVGYILILISSGLANAGGIGGGPLMVIILVIFCGIRAYNSVPISQLIIFGGSCTAIAIKVLLRHPSKQRPLIDYDIALLLSSPLLLGTSIGIIINQVMPQWLILVLLTVLLIYISIDTTKTAIRAYKKENTTKTSITIMCPDTDVFISEDQIPPELQRIYEIEKKVAPPKSVFIICVVFVLVSVFALIRGSSSLNSFVGISFCGNMYWIVTIVFYTILAAISIYSGFLMKTKYIIKSQLHYDFDTFDLKWSTRVLLIIIISGFIAGIAAGLVGVGGGLVMNPVMMKLGMRPEVSTATSSFMVLFTSTSSVIQFTISGNMSWVLGSICFVSSIIGSALGIFVIRKLVRKYQRNSIIVIILAIILIICAVVIPVYGIIDYLNNPKSDGFRDYCATHSADAKYGIF